MGDDRLEKLREAIQQRAIFLGKDHPVVSPKGHGQGWLIDLRMTLLDGASLGLVADLFWERFACQLPFQVGGLEAGSIPLVVAIAMVGQQRGTPVNAFIVRKERKPHGLSKTIEGVLTDDPIVIVDDLINSGSGMEKVRVLLGEAGHRFRDLFVVIDYEAEEGRRWLQQYEVGLTSLFRLVEFGLELKPSTPRVTRSEFREVWRFRSPEPNYFHVVPKSTPALDDRRGFFGSDSGGVWGLGEDTGAGAWTLWGQEAGRGDIWSSPARHAGPGRRGRRHQRPRPHPRRRPHGAAHLEVPDQGGNQVCASARPGPRLRDRRLLRREDLCGGPRERAGTLVGEDRHRHLFHAAGGGRPGLRGVDRQASLRARPRQAGGDHAPSRWGQALLVAAPYRRPDLFRLA